jgi:hypothetical protein
MQKQQIQASANRLETSRRVLTLAGGLGVLVLTSVASPDAATAQSAAVPAVRLPAPIGHRQPRAQDLPPNVRRDEAGATAEQRALDKKLEICRNC